MAIPSDIERTLAILKPDAVRRGLVGEIIARIRTQGHAHRRHEADPDRPPPCRTTLCRAQRQVLL